MNMDNRMLQSAAIAGVAIGVLSGVPCISVLNCLLCAWVWGGAAFGVWWYQRQAGPTSAVTSGQGATLGAIAGAIGGAVSGILNIVVSAAGMGSNAALMQQYMSQLPPDQQQLFAQYASTAAGIGGQLAVLVCGVFLFAIIGALGGLLGAALFGKPKTGMAGPAM